MSALVDPRTLRARRILLCLGLVAAPILVAVAFALEPNIGDDPTPAEELGIIADHRSDYAAAGILGVIGFGCFILGAAALSQLARARGAAWVTTGAAMTAVGAFSMGATFWGFAVAARLLTADGVDRDAAAQILDEGNESAYVGIGWGVGMAVLLGLIVIGIGLLRARTVPQWLAALLIVSPFTAFFAGDDKVLSTLGWIPMIAAFALLAREVLSLPVGAEPAARIDLTSEEPAAARPASAPAAPIG